MKGISRCQFNSVRQLLIVAVALVVASCGGSDPAPLPGQSAPVAVDAASGTVAALDDKRGRDGDDDGEDKDDDGRTKMTTMTTPAVAERPASATPIPTEPLFRLSAM